MPDSYITFGEGTTRKLRFVQRTVASDAVEEQVLVRSEPYLWTYVVTASNVSTATADSHLLQLMGSPLNRRRLRRLTVYQRAAASANTVAAFRLVRLTTAGTGGTTVDPVVYDLGQSGTTLNGMTLPTAKGTEGSVLGAWTGVFLSAPGAAPLLDIRWDDACTKPPTITASTSSGVALRLLTAVASATVSITLVFTEVFWS